MNYYVSNGVFYAVPQRYNELYHWGVKGMKWGRRKARPTAVIGTRRQTATTGTDQTAVREARKAKIKKAAKIGAIVAGTALAAYGAYKLDKAVKNKAYTVAHSRGVMAASKYMEGYKLNNTSSEALRRTGNIGRYLSESNHNYARRSSKTTAAAIKTLLGKNLEIPEAELWNMGINTPRF